MNNQPVFWKMRNGELISVDDMDIKHLRNTLKMIIRNHKKAVQLHQTKPKFKLNGDIAKLFNKSFVGKVNNDDDGRMALKDNIVDHHKELQRVRAIENFISDDVTVEKGKDKKSVLVTDKVTPVNAMEKLYMNVIVA